MTKQQSVGVYLSVFDEYLPKYHCFHCIYSHFDTIYSIIWLCFIHICSEIAAKLMKPPTNNARSLNRLKNIAPGISTGELILRYMVDCYILEPGEGRAFLTLLKTSAKNFYFKPSRGFNLSQNFDPLPSLTLSDFLQTLCKKTSLTHIQNMQQKQTLLLLISVSKVVKLSL